MKYDFLRASLASLSVAVAVSACGGGGDGGDSTTPPATSNPPSSAPTSNAKLADSSNGYANVKTAYAATTYAAQNVTNVYEFLLGGVLLAANTTTAGTETLSCTSGGSATLTLTDADNSKTISAGDSANVTFNNCQDTLNGTPVVLSGTASFAVKAASGTVNSSNSDWTLTVDETANQLSMAAGGASALISGAMTLEVQYTNAPRSSYVKAIAANVTATHTSASGNQIVVGMPSFVLTDNYSASSGTDTVGFSGALSATFNKGASVLQMSLATPTPLVSTGGTVGSGSVTLTSGSETTTATFASASTINITGAANLTTSPSELNAILTN
ncbi:hypothetical protein [Burkholderia cepacia]|uniref:hypothetical protein n=1 Tax=Burkholderia cepacia TaxID=292 RepID=UPI002ABDE29F|nr:hypothetical protein [Burkholderia cepacia]